jgi:pyruvate/2-oxoglutarate dehydrogenase complex dihydrolipoamide acyltransferase (E2) component
LIEITKLKRLRRCHAEEVAAEGGRFTLTPFLVKALADALREHPRYNATFDAERGELEIIRSIPGEWSGCKPSSFNLRCRP